MIDDGSEVAGFGNTTDAKIDKFAHIGLTPLKAEQVAAFLIAKCHACFECRLPEAALVDSLNFFVLEVVEVHIAPTHQHPETLHYRGDGSFMVSDKVISRRGLFRPEMLD